MFGLSSGTWRLQSQSPEHLFCQIDVKGIIVKNDLTLILLVNDVQITLLAPEPEEDGNDEEPGKEAM